MGRLPRVNLLELSGPDVPDLKFNMPLRGGSGSVPCSSAFNGTGRSVVGSCLTRARKSPPNGAVTNEINDGTNFALSWASLKLELALQAFRCVPDISVCNPAYPLDSGALRLTLSALSLSKTLTPM